MKHKLEKSSMKDIEKLAEYKKQNIFEYADNLSNEEIEQINDYVYDSIQKEIDSYQNIIVDDNIVGCLLLTDTEEGKLLDEIYLESEYRNHGIGSSIIKNIIQDHNIIYLWVYILNKNAIALYQKLGFAIICETDSRYYMRYPKR